MSFLANAERVITALEIGLIVSNPSSKSGSDDPNVFDRAFF